MKLIIRILLSTIAVLVADLLLSGEVTPVIDRTYPLAEAADALAFVGAGHTRGKVVITI